MRRRIRMAARLKGDRRGQAIVKRHLANDPVAFFNDWVWTYDPRNTGAISKRLPMRLWPRQEDLVLWLVGLFVARQHGLVKKGRDVGATWIAAGIAVWLWLFHEDTTVTFGSRKQDLVDKLGDPKTIFSKIRDIIAYLPKWMLPAGFKRSEHDNFLRIINPENGSIITGEAGDEAGRGGRSSIYLFDEFAFLPRAERVKAAIMDNSDCVIEYSTSNGLGTQFHADEVGGAMAVFRINYLDDPRKAPHDAWRAKKIAEIGPVNFAREHEMDDASALDRVVIPATWVMAAVGYELESGAARQAGLDVATVGDAETVLVGRSGAVLELLDAWQGLDTTESAERAARTCVDHRYAVLAYDSIGVGAGVEGELRRRQRAIGAGQALGFQFEGVNGGSAPTDTVYDDAPETPATERFRNLRAELWWSLRRRFEKTYQHRNGYRSWPLDEQISIPNDSKLIAQLSSVLWQPTEGGKIKIESKEDMRKRGVASPDRADATVYAYAEVQTGGAWWV